MITPSFSLNFTSAVLDPRITFTRSGATATRVNASGLVEVMAADTARFDFDAVTLQCRGLLIEQTKQNILLRSQEFNDAYWTKTRVTITANAAIAPDGTLTADKIISDVGVNSHFVQRASLASTTGTISVFAKAAEFTFLKLSSNANSFAASYFDLVNGTVAFKNPNHQAFIENFGNGWYRCAITPSAAFTTAAVENAGNGANPTHDGNGVDGIYIWGAQAEAGGFTSYIPTISAAVTRNADVATITGANFSDWWQASKGGVLVRARPGTVSGTRPWVQFDDGTANEIIALRGNATNPELYIVDGGVAQAQIDAGTIAANTDYSMTGWWATNDCKARLDGGAVVTDTSATIPTVTQARLGSDGTNYLNGHLATVNYYDSFFGQSIYTRRKNKVFASLF